MEKPHLVLVPLPTLGHVTAFLKLAKLLHPYNFHITIVITEFGHARLLKSLGPSAFAGLPDFRFETIPDGLPPCGDGFTMQDLTNVCEATSKNCLAPFKKLLARLNGDGSGVPKVTGVVTDGLMSFAVEAAKDLGVMDVVFWTASACGLLGYLQFARLIAAGLVPFRDDSDLTNEYLDTQIDWIPGTTTMRLKDIPSYIRTTDRSDIMLNYFTQEATRISTSSAIILNTYDDLESSVLAAMANTLPPLYAIGPLALLSQHIPQNSPLISIGLSPSKEDTSCLDWLQGKEPRTVLVVNFGGMATMTRNQLVEFAWGLANSKTYFLWIVGYGLALPEEFLAETKDRGLLASRYDQLAVLMHEAVGGFATFCEWNTTMDSIRGGVPMLCWPFFADQQPHSRYLCTEWGIGMEIGGEMKREGVEEIVKELMEGEKGKEMRRRASEWKKMAVNATLKPEGKSFVNFDKVVREVLLPK